MRGSLALLLTASLAACSGSRECGYTAPCLALHSTASGVAGSWAEVEAWRGLSMQMTLVARDTTLSGSATYGVTGASGSTTGRATITGYVFRQDSMPTPAGFMMPAHPVVVLYFAFGDGTSARFDQAVLRGHDTLSGALTFSDHPYDSYGTSFVRANLSDLRSPRSP